MKLSFRFIAFLTKLLAVLPAEEEGDGDGEDEEEAIDNQVTLHSPNLTASALFRIERVRFFLFCWALFGFSCWA